MFLLGFLLNCTGGLAESTPRTNKALAGCGMAKTEIALEEDIIVAVFFMDIIAIGPIHITIKRNKT